MGFYYNPGTQPPDDEDKPATMKETAQIIWVVFRTLAMPLGIILGGILYLLMVFYLFTISGWLGLAGILLVVAAIVALGVWEKTHPPSLEELHKHQRP